MTPKLLAMALLLPGGHLGGLGGSADGVGGSVEGVWGPPIVPGGLRWRLVGWAAKVPFPVTHKALLV